MRVRNVWIYGENQSFFHGEVCVKDGRIEEVKAYTKAYSEEPDSAYSPEDVDGNGCYLIPGLIDIHFHGCVGADFSDGDADALQKMAEYEASIGVTTICPASMTIPEEQLHLVMRMAGEYQEKTGARFAGVNMEGPFVSEKKKGAQAAENIRSCDLTLFRQLQKEARGRIRMVDIAPETEGAIDFIKQVKEEVVVSLAHTTADYDTSMEAFQAGARHVTHLYNAMPPFSHREPGVIGAARDTKNCRVELICDGIHLHPSVIRAAFAMFGADRIILVSDSMRATGMKDGTYTLGGQEVMVCGPLAALRDGTIAGSVTNLMDCLRYAVQEAEIPLEAAIGAATINPAKEIGIYDCCGSITKGKYADFVLMDRNLDIVGICINGQRFM